jgi:hypothetical protein
MGYGAPRLTKSRIQRLLQSSFWIRDFEAEGVGALEEERFRAGLEEREQKVFYFILFY